MERQRGWGERQRGWVERQRGWVRDRGGGWVRDRGGGGGNGGRGRKTRKSEGDVGWGYRDRRVRGGGEEIERDGDREGNREVRVTN